eukprot:134382-Pleurochrysis_carterae.AAC.1
MQRRTGREAVQNADKGRSRKMAVSSATSQTKVCEFANLGHELRQGRKDVRDVQDVVCAMGVVEKEDPYVHEPSRMIEITASCCPLRSLGKGATCRSVLVSAATLLQRRAVVRARCRRC